MDTIGQVATTAHGQLIGEIEANGVFVFRGVRYASAPSGEGRFQAPREVMPWTGIRQATSFAPIAPQPASSTLTLDPRALEAFGLAGEDPPSGDDCLALNIWTPGLEGRRPVLVWLHGGGFVSGAGSAPGRPATFGDKLACHGDAVVVTLNHRLGCLGFLDLSSMDSVRFPHSGNVGMLDIVAALSWVRDNIAAFGGDPSNVTLFGESGGGFKIAVLMAMPVATPLFHRAILQSGVGVVGNYTFGLRCASRDEAAIFTREIFAELDLQPSDLDAFCGLDSETLVAAQRAVIARRGIIGGPVGALPVADERLITSDLFRPSKDAVKPMVIGTTSHEVATMLIGQPWFGNIRHDEVTQMLKPLLGSGTTVLLASYRDYYPMVSATRLVATILSDRWRLLTRQAAMRAADCGAPVWVYEFAYETDVVGGLLGACHAIDIAFAFNTPERTTISGTDRASLGVASAMSAAWVGFARNGVPGRPDGISWPAFSATQLSMRIDREWSLTPMLPAPIHEAWERAAATGVSAAQSEMAADFSQGIPCTIS